MQYGTDGYVIMLSRRTYQSAQPQPIMPRFRDLGIAVSPSRPSEYQYLNRDPGHASSTFVRPLTSSGSDSRRYGQAVPSRQHARSSLRASDYSRQVLPGSAWQTVTRQQTDKGSPGSQAQHQSDATRQMPIFAPQYQMDAPPVRSEPRYQIDPVPQTTADRYQTDLVSQQTVTRRQTDKGSLGLQAQHQSHATRQMPISAPQYQMDAPPVRSEPRYRIDPVPQPTADRYQTDLVSQRHQGDRIRQRSAASRHQSATSSKQLVSQHHVDNIPEQLISQYQPDTGAPHQIASQYQIDTAAPQQLKSQYQPDMEKPRQLASQFLPDPAPQRTAVQYPADSPSGRSASQYQIDTKQVISQQTDSAYQTGRAMQYQTEQSPPKHTDKKVVATKTSKTDQASTVTAQNLRQDKIHTVPYMQPDQSSQKQTLNTVGTREKKPGSKILMANQKANPTQRLGGKPPTFPSQKVNLRTPVLKVSKSQKRTIPVPSLITDVPQPSEFVTANEVKRTKVPTGKSKTQTSSADKVVTPTNHVAYEVASKPISQTSQIVLGLDRITLDKILRDYNLTAVGSVFLTPETRQRNAIALQNVVRRIRPRRRGGRRRRFWDNCGFPWPELYFRLVYSTWKYCDDKLSLQAYCRLNSSKVCLGLNIVPSLYGVVNFGLSLQICKTCNWQDVRTWRSQYEEKGKLNDVGLLSAYQMVEVYRCRLSFDNIYIYSKV